MPDPRPPKRERRPDNVPVNWPTRQQAAKQLNITEYLLRQYMAKIADTATNQIIDLGRGKPAYLSPQMVDEIDRLHKSIENARDVVGYHNRTEAETVIGCYPQQFTGLVNDNPPNIKNGDMRFLRNNNSQIFPYYSDAYVAQLKKIYGESGRATQGPVAGRSEQRSYARHSVDSSSDRMTTFLEEEIAEQGEPEALEPNQKVDEVARTARQLRLQKQEKDLVHLSNAEHQEATRRVQEALQNCERITRLYLQDPTLQNIQRQLQMAAQALREGEVIPQGLDRLFEALKRYSDDRD